MLLSCCFRVLLIFSILQFIFGQISRLSCRRTASFELKEVDKKLKTGIISKRQAPSINTCISACVGNEVCRTINFKIFDPSAEKFNCELIGVVDGSEEWEESNGWNHYKQMSEVSFDSIVI